VTPSVQALADDITAGAPDRREQAHRSAADTADVVDPSPDFLCGVLENFIAGDRGNTF